MNLIPRIDRLLEARSENGSEKGNDIRDYFYVSEVDSCPRALFYKMKGYPKEPFTPTTYRKLDNGDYVHRRIMSMLLSLGIVVASEIRIPGDKIFHGRADPWNMSIISLKTFSQSAGRGLTSPLRLVRHETGGRHFVSLFSLLHETKQANYLTNSLYTRNVDACI
jgi:hypothetical protein